MTEHAEFQWHDEEELFLANVQRQCEVLYRQNIKDLHYYDQLSSRFNIPILVISAVNSLTAVGLNSFIQQEYVSVLNAVLSAGTGVLGSIQLYLKLNEKMTRAARSSVGFKRISLKISKELALAREVRKTDGPTFVSECFADYNQTLESSNPIEKKLEEFLAIRIDSQSATPSSEGSIPMRTVAERLRTIINSRSNV
jgi:hypothetical protein